MTFDLVAVASVAVGLYKLAATLLADVALFAILVTVLGAIARFASWAFHHYSMQRRMWSFGFLKCRNIRLQAIKHVAKP